MNKNIVLLIILIIPVVLIAFFWRLNYLFGSEKALKEKSAQKNAESTAATVSGTVLDLSGRNLAKVPSYVFSEITLEELDVSNNDLTGALPSEIGNLKNLKVLKASNNKMTGVPAEVGHLEKLEILDLSNNQLTGLPYELGDLKNLKILNLSGNNYSKQDLDIIENKLPSNTEIIL